MVKLIGSGAFNSTRLTFLFNGAQYNDARRESQRVRVVDHGSMSRGGVVGFRTLSCW